jgi:hypothetical protein
MSLSAVLVLGLAYSRQASEGLLRATGLAGKIEVEFQQAPLDEATDRERVKRQGRS